MLITYLLYHIYEYGDENEHEELKILGIYSSEAKAKAAIQYYKNLSGFSKYPLSCFVIDSYRVDANAGWRGGFCSTDDIYSDLDNLAQCFTEWTEGRYTLFEDVYNSPLLNDVYSLSCQERNPKALTDRLQEIWHKYFPQIRYRKDDFLCLADKISTILELNATDKNKEDKNKATFQTAPTVGTVTKNTEEFTYLCKCGSAQQVKDVLHAGMDINAKNEFGMTALMWAARDNTNPEVVKLLLEDGADIRAKDEEGRTALMWAARNNTNPEVIRVLLEAGTDVNVRDKKLATALILAAKWNSDGIVNALIDAGADIAIKDDEEKQAADYAQENKKLKSTDTLRRLWGIFR